MNYPLWNVPFIGGIWVVGLIAILHVFISHFAVGGGAFFALTEHLAIKRNDNRMMNYLKSHAKFFLLLTTVLGVVTGVGIWWAISLVNPSGTATLIQNYTLLWAIEYLFFLTEIATIFVYYYTWDKIPSKQHEKIAWFYFGISIFTLVVINGILTFMLTPGSWVTTHSWVDGFFNQTYWPSFFIRLLIMLAIAGMYAMLTSAFIKNDLPFRTQMLRYASKWFLPLFILGPIVGFWYLWNIPQASIETIFHGIQSSGVGNFSFMARVIYLSLFLSGTVLIFAFVGPYLNPKGFSVQSAALFLITGLVVTGITELSRELLRKPYVVYNYMYSNGIRKDQVADINRTGFIPVARWAPASPSHLEVGQAMFQNQCMSCHTVDGYRSIKRLLGERDKDAIQGFLTTIHETDPKKNPYGGIMPPVVGKPEELADLATYLDALKQGKLETTAMTANVTR